MSRLFFAAAVLVHLLVLYAPAAPGPGGLPEGTDKVTHLVVFALVAWTGRRVGLSAYVLAVALVAHAGLSEVVQATWLPGRSGDPVDVLANLAGTVLGLLLPARSDRRGMMEV